MILSVVKEYTPMSLPATSTSGYVDGESFNLDTGLSFLILFNLMSGFTESLQSKLLRTHWFSIE